MNCCNKSGKVDYNRRKQILEKAKQMRPIKPWDLLKKENWTVEELRLKRLEICEACEHFTKLRQCDYCHCFMDAKTWLQDAYCPIRKW